LVLDIGLVAGGQGNGLAVIRRLSPATRIVLTGDDDCEEYTEVTRSWGGFKYLAKASFPVAASGIIDEVRALVAAPTPSRSNRCGTI